MEPNRGFADDADPRWYAGEYPAEYPGEHQGDRGFEPRYGDAPGRNADAERYEPMPQRGARGTGDGRYAALADIGADLPSRPVPGAGGSGPGAGGSGPGGPGRGDRLFSPEEAARFHAAADDAARRPAPAAERSVAAPAVRRSPMVETQHAPQVSENVYRAKRPGAAALLIILAVGFGLFVLRVLAGSVLGEDFSAAGVLASGFTLAALPLLVMGMYGLITGAAHGAEHAGFRLWAKPPLAYLVVGLTLVLAAGLAIGH